ncbi:MAG: D-alanine--D-alanine ligase [Parcubacteria bacterium OLB19]|nr:MAG: D-alanine--D-alanine ligase [Parcubacteria bacterium OLB19]
MPTAVTNKKDIIVYVMNLPEGAIDSIRKYEKITKTKYRIMLLWDERVKDKKDRGHTTGLDLYVSCDFSSASAIAKALLPYQDQLLAITCRSEKSMARFAEVVPHVSYLHTPTTDSLRWASDKYLMRKRFKIYDPTITPKFTLIKENTKEERARITKKIGFPMIIKPTNLAASLFVSICYHEEDLVKTLQTTLKRLHKAYEHDNRLEEPKLIAEEYMDGDMYSVDSYVNEHGEVYHCPLVKVITGKKIGHDDFYNYLQITPPLFKAFNNRKGRNSGNKRCKGFGFEKYDNTHRINED